MLYQITCTCGHTFQRSDEQLKSPVACPACGKALSVVIQSPATATPTAGASTTAEPTKRCPFCGEVILAIAKKCKHCGEFLDRAALSPGGGASGSATPAPAEEPPVFALSVSQWDNFWKYLICLIVGVLVSGVLLKVEA